MVKSTLCSLSGDGFLVDVVGYAVRSRLKAVVKVVFAVVFVSLTFVALVQVQLEHERKFVSPDVLLISVNYVQYTL